MISKHDYFNTLETRLWRSLNMWIFSSSSQYFFMHSLFPKRWSMNWEWLNILPQPPHRSVVLSSRIIGPWLALNESRYIMYSIFLPKKPFSAFKDFENWRRELCHI